ncbi:hypothetical protein TNCV_2871271 [Trichonephila clavipes]|nr:hypothetical protein TNCV_2871271 [Trichonephila clavipes]
MDDVIISSPSFTHHVEHLRDVFRLLQEERLTLIKFNWNKFGKDKLKYLGLIISKDGIATDETKVQAIVEMKLPKDSKEESKLLGMFQWYSKCIKNYADLYACAMCKLDGLLGLDKTHPLSSATKKVVAKFKPKFEGPSRVLEEKHNNLVIWRSRKRLRVNVDQSKGNSDAQYQWIQPRPTNEKRAEQGVPVLVRGSQEHQFSPYIGDQATSAGRKTRSRCGQQHH